MPLRQLRCCLLPPPIFRGAKYFAASMLLPPLRYAASAIVIFRTYDMRH